MKLCEKCGAHLEDVNAFCNNCGHKQPVVVAPPKPVPSPMPAGGVSVTPPQEAAQPPKPVSGTPVVPPPQEPSHDGQAPNGQPPSMKAQQPPAGQPYMGIPQPMQQPVYGVPPTQVPQQKGPVMQVPASTGVQPPPAQPYAGQPQPIMPPYTGAQVGQPVPPDDGTMPLPAAPAPAAPPPPNPKPNRNARVFMVLLIGVVVLLLVLLVGSVVYYTAGGKVDPVSEVPASSSEAGALILPDPVERSDQSATAQEVHSPLVQARPEADGGAVPPDYIMQVQKNGRLHYISTYTGQVLDTATDSDSTKERFKADSTAVYFYGPESTAGYGYDFYYADFLNQPVLVDTGVDQYFVAADGETVVYETEDGLFQYAPGMGEAANLTAKWGEFAISPNGEWLAMYELADDNNEVIVWSADNSQVKTLQVQEYCIPDIISDDGRYLVYDEGEASDAVVFYDTVEGTSVRLELEENYSEMFTNRTADEVLVASESGLYLFRDGALSHIDDIDIWDFMLLHGRVLVSTYQAMGPFVMDIDSFASVSYVTSGSSVGNGELSVVHWDGSGLQLVDTTDNYDEAHASIDGSRLFYRKDDALYRADSADGFAPKLLAEDLMNYEISPDGGVVIYYTHTGEGQLHYLDENDEVTQLGSFVSVSWLGGADGRTCVYVDDARYDGNGFVGTAKQYHPGGEPQTLAENVMRVYPMNASGTVGLLLKDEGQNGNAAVYRDGEVTVVLEGCKDTGALDFEYDWYYNSGWYW